MEIPKVPLSTVVTVGVVGTLLAGYAWFKSAFSSDASAQAFANQYPNLAALLISLGFKTPTNHVPDVTGTGGAKTAAQAQLAAEGVPATPANITATETGTPIVPANATSQAYYDTVLQEYAYDNNFDTSLAAQGTAGWPWGSYGAWVSAGYPTLPASATMYVTVDANGVFHNQYV